MRSLRKPALKGDTELKRTFHWDLPEVTYKYFTTEYLREKATADEFEWIFPPRWLDPVKRTEAAVATLTAELATVTQKLAAKKRKLLEMTKPECCSSPDKPQETSTTPSSVKRMRENVSVLKDILSNCHHNLRDCSRCGWTDRTDSFTFKEASEDDCESEYLCADCQRVAKEFC